MILSSETNPADAQQMLEFYKQHFAVVELVSCSNCGSMLAFECQGGDSMGLPANELGKIIIPIGDALLSSRVRLDEAPTGERMMGYQCGAMVSNPAYATDKATFDAEITKYDAQYKKEVAAAKKKKQEEPIYSPPIFNTPETIACGNDTRISDIERGKVPVGQMQVSLSPFEKHQIREEIKKDRTYKPDFRKVGKIKHFETFQVERL